MAVGTVLEINGKDGVSPRRLFYLLVPVLLMFRLWLAAALPITADEAYFIWWGIVPDWGYYDHPPMVGWMFAAQYLFGGAGWWLRMSSTLEPFFLAAATLWFVPRIWPGTDDDRRWWAGLLVLLAPAFVWNILVTTDVPLAYFSVVSGLCWLRARRDDSLRWYLASGVLLAGAVLSKYFVAFLGFAYLVDILRRPTRRGFAGLLIAYLCCVPAIIHMAWWNSGHCWPNYMFNIVNRNDDAKLSWQTPLLYMAMMVYLLTPPGLWAAVRTRIAAERRSLAMIAYVPLAMFSLLSLEKTIGLHWVLSFLPFTLVGLALALPRERLQRLGFFFLGFAALHVALIVGASFTRLELWQKTKWYDSAVLAFEAEEIVRRLQPYANDYAFASNGYADAATLSFRAGRNFMVFGEGSSHARHDDILTDVRSLDGRDIVIVRKSAPQTGEYDPYFRELRVETFVLHGVTFYEIFGRGFNYNLYRDTVLSSIRDKYYRIPRWLPQRACYFRDRYWPGMEWPPR